MPPVCAVDDGYAMCIHFLHPQGLDGHTRPDRSQGASSWDILHLGSTVIYSWRGQEVCIPTKWTPAACFGWGEITPHASTGKTEIDIDRPNTGDISIALWCPNDQI